ncbi:MAG: oxygen-independent coproporphyrinogen III oxidase [Calditrichia bacterium]
MTKKFEVDISVLKKYDKAGPRYTSYPTAPHFHPKFTQEDLIREIKAGNEAENPKPLSLYFHIPFCEQLCYYCACNTYITHNHERIDAYLKALKQEIRMYHQYINTDRKVVQMHWGGGTPTYLKAEQIRSLTEEIKTHFEFDSGAEISIEVDPRQAGEGLIEMLAELGFNRISFGVQDTQLKVQQSINRIQSIELNKSVVERARKAGFKSVNIDLIYGLPSQTLESYRQTLQDVLAELNPDRLAVFNFAHVPWLKKHQNLIKKEELPPVEEKLEILKLVIEYLTSHGYEFIGMDHFARPDDELTRALKSETLYRNFQGYNTHAEAEVFAMGATSISQLSESYSQNVRSDNEYKKIIDSGKLPIERGIKLTKDDLIRRDVITELMCNNVVYKNKINQKYDIDFNTYFEKELPRLNEFMEDHLLVADNEKIQVQDSGRLIVRNIAMVFDAYLEDDIRKQKNMYSRTV